MTWILVHSESGLTQLMAVIISHQRIRGYFYNELMRYINYVLLTYLNTHTYYKIAFKLPLLHVISVLMLERNPRTYSNCHQIRFSLSESVFQNILTTVTVR